MDVTKLLEFSNHELVSYVEEPNTGLRAFIAIHNTNRGRAAGATRYWYYPSSEEALRDALRLSRAMTYKCALAGVPFGGGKGVIMGDRRAKKTPALLGAYARKLNLLGGNFYTGEDVGMSIRDVRIMAKETKFVIGLKNTTTPPFWTAVGVLEAIRVALEEVFGSQAVEGRTFAIKGLGKVGIELCQLLYKRGGIITAADTDMKAVRFAKKRFPKIRIVPSHEILFLPTDVLCPCALDGDLNSKSIPQLRCSIVCGGANNQLASPDDGAQLYRKDILYIPDYLANAGGLIDVVAELDPRGYDRRRVARRVHAIQKTTRRIIALSRRTKRPTSEVADRMAEKIFNGTKRHSALGAKQMKR